MTQPAVFRHLEVLESTALIARRTEGTKRSCRRDHSAIDEIDQWTGVLRQALTKTYNRLDDVLAGMRRSKKKGKRWQDKDGGSVTTDGDADLHLRSAPGRQCSLRTGERQGRWLLSDERDY